MTKLQRLFPHYYVPNEEELANLWEAATFAFDASALLNLYAYSPATRQQIFNVLEKLQDRLQIFNVLEKLQDRLWLPHQAALEYQRNRLRVIVEQRDKQLDLDRVIIDAQSQALAADKTKSLDFVSHQRQIREAFMAAYQALRALRPVEANYLEADPLRDQIAALFGDHIGDPYCEKCQSKVYTQGNQRYKDRVPPGFMDQEKTGTKRYGDLVLWFQLIDQAKVTRRPVMFLTDDVKADWWIGHNGRAFLPLPQLVEEMQREAGVAFYMFTLTGFFYQAQRHDLLIEHRALKELEANLREREAQMARDQEMLAAGGIRAEYVALKNLVTLFGQEADPASVRFFDRYIAHSKERLAALEQRILAEDIESGAVEVLNTPVEEGEAETQL